MRPLTLALVALAGCARPCGAPIPTDDTDPPGDTDAPADTDPPTDTEPADTDDTEPADTDDTEPPPDTDPPTACRQVCPQLCVDAAETDDVGCADTSSPWDACYDVERGFFACQVVAGACAHVLLDADGFEACKAEALAD